LKILFITDNFPPEVNAPATRTYEHCKEWVKEGAEVTVITCAPNFPVGKVYDGYKNRLYQKENIEGIEVIRVWSFIAANRGKIRRVLDYISFAFTSFVAGLFQKPDVIIATSPQFFTTWSALGLSKIKRKPWIFELRDLWPESISTVGAMKEGAAVRFLHGIEMGLYKDAAKVIPVTEAFKKNLVSRGIEAEKIEVITNGANTELYTPREKNAELLKKLGLENKFVIGYIGTHGMAHNLEFIVRAIKKIKDPDIYFLFIGGGAKKEDVMKLASHLGVSNASFHVTVPKEKVADYLSIIDVSLAPLKKSDTFKTVIPSKIFEAAAMRKPTLLGVDGQAREIIEKYDAGLYFEPENEADFLDKVKKIKEDRELYKRLQKGCEGLAEAYDRKKLAIEMLNAVRNTATQTS